MGIAFSSPTTKSSPTISYKYKITNTKDSFETQYGNYNKKKDRIKFNSQYRYVTGSGGSNNAIYIGDKYVYKIIPFAVKGPNQRKRLDHDQKEINVYKILTKEFVLNNNTPHIVGYFDKYKINLKSLLPTNCPTIENKLTKKNPFGDKSRFICNIDDHLKKGIFSKKADVVVLEKCPITINMILYNLFKSSNVNKYKKISDFIDRIIFQVVFTLSIIQDKYPTFVHNDFFLRNILGVHIDKYKKNHYTEYKFNNKKFYIPANGISLKINDFGYTLAKPNMLSTQMLYDIPQIDCKKCDIYCFLYDLYNGENMGSTSMMSLMENKNKK